MSVMHKTIFITQAEAEVVPSSSLVEVYIEGEIGVEVEVRVGDKVEVGRCSLDGVVKTPT